MSNGAPVLLNRYRETLAKKYLLTLEVTTADGRIGRGNVWFSSPDPITQALLDSAKLKHIENLKKEGVDVSPSKAIILNLIKLEA